MPALKRKTKTGKREAHIYLSEADHKRLMERASKESRSITGQLLYYVKRGLEQDGK